MAVEQIFQDGSLKAKSRVSSIGEQLLQDKLTLEELVAYAKRQNAKNKASCIEALEYATKKSPGIADQNLLVFVTEVLEDDESRVKWESAKVIANIAKLFSGQLEKTIHNLLANAENSGTVVRWATALALAEILIMKTENFDQLLPKIEALYEKEEDGGVRKKYLAVLQKVKK